MNLSTTLKYKIMKKVLIVFVVFCSFQQVNSQTDTLPETAFAKMYLPVWEEAVAHCLAIAKAMPEASYSYKPTEVSKTFGEQMVHIAASTKLLTQRYVQGMEVKPNTPDASNMSKEEILELLHASFNYTKKTVQTIKQEQLDETCKMYHSGNVVSRAFALFYVQDHMANHRAKSNLYLRINGIEPPEYTW